MTTTPNLTVVGGAQVQPDQPAPTPAKPLTVERLEGFLAKYSSAPLINMVEARKELLEIRQQAFIELQVMGGELTPELEHKFAMVEATLPFISQLLEKKVDDFVSYVQYSLPEKIAALKGIVAWHENLHANLKELASQSLMGLPTKKLEGTAMRMRMQRNSQPKVEVINADEVPQDFKKVVVEFKLEIPAKDKAIVDKWTAFLGTLSKTKGFQGKHYPEVDMDKVREKITEDVDAQTGEIIGVSLDVPGIKIEQGYHIRMEKMKAQAAKKKK